MVKGYQKPTTLPTDQTNHRTRVGDKIFLQSGRPEPQLLAKIKSSEMINAINRRRKNFHWASTALKFCSLDKDQTADAVVYV